MTIRRLVADVEVPERERSSMRVTDDGVEELQLYDKEEIARRLRLKSTRQVDRLVADPTCPLHGQMFPIKGTKGRKGCSAEVLRATLRWAIEPRADGGAA
jgi:hypothetical protein